MNNAVVANVERSLFGEYSEPELYTIQNTIAKGTSPDQFALFIKTCISSGLNPFLNHIYAVNYGGTMSIQISVEGILFLARKVDGYKGVDAQLIHENDEFEADYDDNNGIKITKHKIKMPRGVVVGCYAIARREGYPDVVVLMEKNEVEKQNSSTWKNWFNDMFKKHVIKRAAKLQYGINIDEGDATDHNPIDITPGYQAGGTKTIEYTHSTAQIASPGTIQTGEDKHQTSDQILAEKREEVRQKMQQAQMEKWQFEEFAMNKVGKLPTEMDVKELILLSRHLDVEIQSIASGASHQPSFLDDVPTELL